MKHLYQKIKALYTRLPIVPRSLMVSIFFQAVAYWGSSILISHTGG